MQPCGYTSKSIRGPENSASFRVQDRGEGGCRAMEQTFHLLAGQVTLGPHGSIHGQSQQQLLLLELVVTSSSV